MGNRLTHGLGRRGHWRECYGGCRGRSTIAALMEKFASVLVSRVPALRFAHRQQDAFFEAANAETKS